MRPEYRHLRAFLVIAEEESFRAAADRLHIAQPALSRQIQQLEAALGFAVFDRQKRKIRLTRAGDSLYRRLPRLFGQIEEALDTAGRIHAGEAVPLRFGYSSAAMSRFLPALIQSIQQQHPQCEFSFFEETSDRLIDGILSERLDAAFALYRPEHAGLKTLPIRPDRIGVILPSAHRLSAEQSVAIGELRDETLILFPRQTNPVMYDELIAHCRESGFSPRRIIETAPRSTAIGLVAAGQGIATISESLQHTCVSGTTYRPLRQPAPMVNYACVVRSECAGAWFDTLVEHIQTQLA